MLQIRHVPRRHPKERSGQQADDPDEQADGGAYAERAQRTQLRPNINTRASTVMPTATGFTLDHTGRSTRTGPSATGRVAENSVWTAKYAPGWRSRRPPRR